MVGSGLHIEASFTDNHEDHLLSGIHHSGGAPLHRPLYRFGLQGSGSGVSFRLNIVCVSWFEWKTSAHLVVRFVGSTVSSVSLAATLSTFVGVDAIFLSGVIRTEH